MAPSMHDICQGIPVFGICQRALHNLTCLESICITLLDFDLSYKVESLKSLYFGVTATIF
jgi:hypothetical protein